MATGKYCDIKHNEVYIFGEIETEMVLEIIQSFNEMDRSKPIAIYIASNGGDLTSGLSLLEVLSHMKDEGVEITTFAVGACCSMAAMVFLTGTHRIIGKNCNFMLHNYLDGGVCDMEHSAILKVTSDHSGWWFDGYIKDLLEDTDIDIDYVKRKWSKTKTINWWIKPEEAIELGLAHELLHKPKRIKKSAETK